MEKAVGILGLGCYVPEKVLTNHDLEKIVETSDEWIVERTGIKNRHIAAEGEATSDMSVIAAERALADAGVSPEEIELVIVATASADHAFPSTACLVQDRIGAKNAAAFDLSAGCSGFVYSLGVASQMVKSGLYKKALIIGAETLSRIMNWEAAIPAFFLVTVQERRSLVKSRMVLVFWVSISAATAAAVNICSSRLEAAADRLLTKQ